MTAQAYLRQLYAAHRASHQRPPSVIHAGRDLFQAFASEVVPCERCDATATAPDGAAPSLMFKAARVVSHGEGWRAEVVA